MTKLKNEQESLLTPIKFVDKKIIGKKRPFLAEIWLYKCKCGKEKEICKRDVVRNNTLSCGCLQKQNHFKLKSGESCFTVLYTQYKGRAKHKNIAFLLSKEEFRNLVIRNCYYCGREPNNKVMRKNYSGEFIYNGIDRINNDQGYVLQNCVTCCIMCNKGKSSLSQNEFLDWIEKVYFHRILAFKRIE